MNQTVESQVIDIIEQITTIELGQYEVEPDLEHDFGIDMETDFPRIVSQLSTHFSLGEEATELLKDMTNLKQIIDIITEETELG